MNSFFGMIRRTVRRTLCAAVVAVAAAAGAQSSAPVAYTISLASPAQHLRELQLPVWNALYQVRDFSQYVNWVRAKDGAGKALAVRQCDKSRWQIQGSEGGAVIDYQIYADSPGPF